MYRVFKIILASLFLLFGQHHLIVGQPSVAKNWIASFEGLDHQYKPKELLFDTADLQLTCNYIIGQLRADGYWLAGIDSMKARADTLGIYFYQGRRFEQVDVEIVDNSSIERVPKFLRSENQELSSLHEVAVKVESVLDYMEANGYPFATLALDSSRVEHDKLKVKLRLDPGSQITFDSLSISPKGIVKPDFLSKYLGLEYGEAYDERSINEVSTRIQHLPFISLEKMNTSFQLKKAQVHLDVERRKINRFNGLLGLVPGRDGEGAVITGELDLAIHNVFQSGKKIEINWKKLEPGAQQLHASYLHPVFLGSPLDFYFELDQVRQDTVFSNRLLKLAFEYRPIRTLQIGLSYSNLLGNKLEDSDDMSGDFDIDNYGLSLSWYKLDNLIHPKKGVRSRWNCYVGRKSVRNDLSIPESTQYSFQNFTEWYNPMGKRSVLYFGGQGGIIFNDYLYLNDLYRLGGLKSIRGFNELVFFASEYALFNLEWRYYLDNFSYLVAFYDQSIMSYEILNGSFEDNPSGLGIGMEFTTDQGNFKILYGLGKRSGEPYSFSSSKIHFGYTAIF